MKSSATDPFCERVLDAFTPTSRGVVGLVDGLLRLSRDRLVRFEYQGERCRVRSLADGMPDLVEVPLAKSGFRAMLARIATLCQRHRHGSVSPYQGEGELIIGSQPTETYHVTFTKTPDDQRMEVQFLAPSNGHNEC